VSSCPTCDPIRWGQDAARPSPTTKPTNSITSLHHRLPKSRTFTSKAQSGLATEFGGGHETVNHSAGEYARGEAGINQAEAFFGLFKRGVVGSFHHISERHMNRYLNEFSFRWDLREATDGERTVEAIKASEGKRLMYRQPISRRSP
jgi:hypothetical protein